MKVMIVNDEPIIIKMIEHILIAKCEVNQSKISKATNGMACVNMAIQEHFDLVIMDIEMPILNGYQACSLLRKNVLDKKINSPEMRQPYIIAVSAATDMKLYR